MTSGCSALYWIAREVFEVKLNHEVSAQDSSVYSKQLQQAVSASFTSSIFSNSFCQRKKNIYIEKYEISFDIFVNINRKIL